MPSAAQVVSLVLSLRPDKERNRLPAGTGELALGFDFALSLQIYNRKDRGEAAPHAAQSLVRAKAWIKTRPTLSRLLRRFPVTNR